MQHIEPFYNWEHLYSSPEDEQSPFFGYEYVNEYTNDIYGYYIHPMWDYIGSETLYLKILFVDYDNGFIIIEFFGEWNDTLHNDVMHLKRNIVDHFTPLGINKFILIGENVLNFHGTDDCYYEEWFEDVEDGWIAALNFREHVLSEWSKFNLDSYINTGGELDVVNWRTLTPMNLCGYVQSVLSKRLR